ncbi:spore germination protein [Neobacillus drentensis]|uniref:spore germination protein n=1 Tax=Neobacillus drentensis TaxID=220684 RepID=UPI001F3BD8F3|nr:spore germination protein [Neobacillus drentensis]ULT56511.1 spore germination protein [Neobacillus drentensis]
MSFIPPVKIDTVSGGVVQFGGALFVSPKSASKTAIGSGSANTGVQIITINGCSATNAPDCDVIDQPIVQDA